MRKTTGSRAIALGMMGIALIAGGCRAATTTGDGGSPSPAVSASASASESPVPTEKPVPVESNPPGDIPDNTQFVPFRSPAGHFEVKVPEGWSRTKVSGAVSFTDKLNTVAVEWSAAPAAPTVSSVKKDQVPRLQASERAFALGKVLGCDPSCTIPYSTAPISVSLPGLGAVVVTYKENSAPSSVTGRQYRLEVIRFDIFRGGEEADLILAGPVGSDNVDPWTLVAESFRWV